MTAVEQQVVQRKQGRMSAGYEDLAIELVQSAVKVANEARSKAEREKEIVFLSDLTNPCYRLMDVSDETVDRIVRSIEDNTYDWYD